MDELHLAYGRLTYDQPLTSSAYLPTSQPRLTVRPHRLMRSQWIRGRGVFFGQSGNGGAGGFFFDHGGPGGTGGVGGANIGDDTPRPPGRT